MTQHDHGRDAFIALLLAASAPVLDIPVSRRPPAAPAPSVAADPGPKVA